MKIFSGKKQEVKFCSFKSPCLYLVIQSHYDAINSIIVGRYQSMEWTGSIRWIYNPVQSRRIWIGLDQKFTNSADSGLDWIQKCAMCIPYLDLRQFLLVVTLTSEVLPSNLQLFTSSFVFTCRFYKVFGRYLCTLLCPDWTGLDSDSGSSAGLDWIRISGSWIWTGLDRFNSIHSILW